MNIKNQKELLRAKKLIKKGEFLEAQELYNKILKEFPLNQEAKKALELLAQKKILARPSQSQIDSIMGLYSTGKIQKASSSIEDLIKKFPSEPLLYNISGACYLAVKQLNLAVTSFEKAIDLNSDYAAAHYNLGVTFQGLNQFDSAMDCYKKAININPAYPDAHNNLGLLLFNSQLFKAAVEHFEWAVAYKPDFSAAHNNLGAAFQELRNFDQSIESYKKAVEINPNYAQAHHNLGISFQVLGDQASSIEHYEKALLIKPEYAQAHQNLSAQKKYTKSDSDILTMENLLSKGDITESDRIFLSFALAKAYDDIGKPKELFKTLDNANSLRKKQLNYSLENSESLHSIIKKLFKSSQSLSTNFSTPTANIRPIFIVGMPRSGTTLVEQIIASHNAVYGAEEINTLSKIVTTILKDPSSYDKKGIPKKTLLSLRNEYLNSLASFDVSENIMTDKWPLNFQYIGFILLAFPEAKIIHLKRDARATCWSNYKHNFSDIGNGWAYNLKDLAGFYSLYSELMTFWHDLFPNKIYDISYEELTINQEEETRKLLEYCELDWDDNCLNFHNSKRAVKTASALQVRKKMYQGSSDAWKKHKTFLQPLINDLKSF